MSPLGLMVLAAILLVIGWILPLFMVLGILQSTFALNFFSYGASMAGLFVGLYGTFAWVRSRRD